MSLSRIRLRLTLGYVGVFALIIILLIAVAIAGFSQELTVQQDELLAQEARNQTSNLLNGENREVLATGSDEFGWTALDLEGRVTETDPAATSLGLPQHELASKALQENEVEAATIEGSDGSVRTVSIPMYDESDQAIGVMQYARSLQGMQKEVNGLVLVLLPLGLSALGLSAIGGAYMAGRAVRPVQEAFERQRTFIADASHELKSPLTLIKLNVDMIHRELTDPDDKELTGEVLAETDHMSAVLSDLLLIARLDAGKLTVKREPFDLASVLSETADRFSTRAADADIRIAVEVTGKLRVLGDRARASQILSILLDNALAYTPSGGSVAVVGSTQDSSVDILVKDTGLGISPEHISRIFERFYRADPARSRSTGGTGLGLSIAQELARAQKGDLKAENAKEGGAVFRLKLPAG